MVRFFLCRVYVRSKVRVGEGYNWKYGRIVVGLYVHQSSVLSSAQMLVKLNYESQREEGPA